MTDKYHYAREIFSNLRTCRAIRAEVYMHWIEKINKEEKLSSDRNSVFVVTENDNYGEPLYHDVFKTYEEAKKYIDSADNLDLECNYTNIIEKEFD
jgi:hypothetical protein